MRFTVRAQQKQAVWMITFADLLALILVFFVMLYAMSDIEGGKWDRIVESIKHSFSASQTMGASQGFHQLGIEKDSFERVSDLSYLYSVLSNKVTKRSGFRQISTVHLWNNKLILAVKSEILFNGDDTLSASLEGDFFKIVQSIQNISNTIEVRNWVKYPIGVQDEKSAWVTSLKRSLRVAEMFREQGRTGDIYATAGPLDLPGDSDKPKKGAPPIEEQLFIIVHDRKLANSETVAQNQIQSKIQNQIR
jgi:chemotaxis protein MotB